MQEIFAWYNTIFYVPLLIGAILSMGLGLSSVGHDVDHNIESDHETDNPGLLGSLGFGRVPFMIILTSLFLLFGGIGLCLNIIASPLRAVWSGFSILSVIGSLVATFFGTRKLSKFVAKNLPSMETDSVTMLDLVGLVGTVTLTYGRSGWLQVTNERGDMYQVPYYTDSDLVRGSKALLIDYDNSRVAFNVTKYSAEDM